VLGTIETDLIEIFVGAHKNVVHLGSLMTHALGCGLPCTHTGWAIGKKHLATIHSSLDSNPSLIVRVDTAPNAAGLGELALDFDNPNPVSVRTDNGHG
jgi:hypothetical protein